MKLIRLFLLLLIFSFVVQNTCPYGFATKTAFASPFTHDCPLKKSPCGSSKGQDFFDAMYGKILNPPFVLSMPQLHALIQSFALDADYVALTSDRYTNPFSEPLIRPPAA